MSIEKKNRREKKRMRKQRYLCFQNERFPDIPKKKEKNHVVSFVGYLNFPMKMRGKKRRIMK